MGEALFIADLHLTEARPDLIRQFLHFLTHRASSAKSLYILGDFFDAWTGDDCMLPWQNDIAKALKTYSLNHELYFMHGNRDFLIGKSFCNKAGCTLLSDTHVLQLHEQKVLLLHGDTLCTLDKTYLWYRAIAHNPITKAFFYKLPKLLRTKITQGLQSISKNKKNSFKNNKERLYIVDAQPEAIEKMLRKYHVDIMIHGHTHRPCEHKHSIKNQDNQMIKATRWVLGSWDTHWWVLAYNNGQFIQEKYPL